jgi:hypothetical protein
MKVGFEAIQQKLQEMEFAKAVVKTKDLCRLHKLTDRERRLMLLIVQKLPLEVFEQSVGKVFRMLLKAVRKSQKPVRYEEFEP